MRADGGRRGSYKVQKEWKPNRILTERINLSGFKYYLEYDGFFIPVVTHEGRLRRTGERERERAIDTVVIKDDPPLIPSLTANPPASRPPCPLSPSLLATLLPHLTSQPGRLYCICSRGSNNENAVRCYEETSGFL